MCNGRCVLSSGEDCPGCMRRGVVACTGCLGRGEVPCGTCAGKGQISCRNCDAQGQVFQQITFHTTVQSNFKLMIGQDLPEEIMRHLRRIKPENLLNGRAEIQVESEEIIGHMIRVMYLVNFPLMALQYQLGDQPMQIVTLGLRPMILEAAHFMDWLLAPTLELLRRARAREVLAATVLGELGKLRFYREAFAAGKNSQELRRRYPFGISGNLLREVPATLGYLLGNLTAQPRMLAAIAFNAVTAIFLLYIYVLGSSQASGAVKHFGVGDIFLCLALLGLNAAAITATHLGISARTLRPFGVRPKFDAARILNILGDTCFISLGVTLLLCIAAWVMR